MSRLFEHAGERFQLLHAALWLVGSLTIMAAAVAFFLIQKHQIGLPAAVGIIASGPVAGAILTAVVWRGSGAIGRGLVDTMTAARGVPRKYEYSAQESLVARGRLAEAVESWQDHLTEFPDDLDARLHLADLYRTHLDDPARAEAGYLEVRTRRHSADQEFRLSNALIDLYYASGQKGRHLAELARFADRFRHTEAGRRAREALRQWKSKTE